MNAQTFRRLRKASAIAIAAAGCSGAFAQTFNLPIGATFDQEIQIYKAGEFPEEGRLPDQEQDSSSAGALTFGSATVTGFYAGGIGTLSLSIANAPTAEHAASEVNYWFEVFGQPATASVLLSGSGSVNAASGNENSITAQMNTPFFDASAVAGNLASGYIPTNLFNVNALETVVTNTPYMISLIVNGLTESTNGVNASIDPSVTLAGNTAGLSLELSPDAFPLAPVPEPDTVWMLVLGLGLLGVMGRLRTKELAARLS